MSTEHTLEIPLDCLGGFVEVFGGQYPLGFSGLREDLVILDIGANCGAFSLACRQRWPRATIHAYEPHPDLFRILCGNVYKLGVKCHHYAVGDAEKGLLFPGKDNDLCGSQVDIGRQNMAAPIRVPVMRPANLPVADLVKIDTEGSEWDIVAWMRLEAMPLVLIVEWHSAENRRLIDEHLARLNYDLLRCEVSGPGWGVSTYARKTGTTKGEDKGGKTKAETREGAK